jgi:hypothetical protein
MFGEPAPTANPVSYRRVLKAQSLSKWLLLDAVKFFRRNTAKFCLKDGIGD